MPSTRRKHRRNAKDCTGTTGRGTALTLPPEIKQTLDPPHQSHPPGQIQTGVAPVNFL
jgi:hypothetical protein